MYRKCDWSLLSCCRVHAARGPPAGVAGYPGGHASRLPPHGTGRPGGLYIFILLPRFCAGSSGGGGARRAVEVDTGGTQRVS